MLPFTFFFVFFFWFLLFCLLFLTGLQHSCYFLLELDREVLQGGLEMTERRSSFIIGRRAVVLKSIEEAREGKSRKRDWEQVQSERLLLWLVDLS